MTPFSSTTLIRLGQLSAKAILPRAWCTRNGRVLPGVMHLRSEDAHVSCLNMSMNEPQFNGSSAIHFAAQSGNIELVEALVKHSPALIAAKNSDGHGPLYWYGHVPPQSRDCWATLPTHTSSNRLSLKLKDCRCAFGRAIAGYDTLQKDMCSSFSLHFLSLDV
jgi:hypothetical protein